MIDEIQFMRDFRAAILEANEKLETKTAEQMAKTTYNVCVDFCKKFGQNPSYEVFIKAPGEPRHFDNDTCWVVAWEAGPWEWAIPISMDLSYHIDKVVEPHYSFDLCFYPSED